MSSEVSLGAPKHKSGTRSKIAAFLKKGLQDGFLVLILPALVIIIWQKVCDGGLIPRIILPAPSLIFDSFLALVSSGELLGHVSISLLRVLEGYLIGAILGIVFGALQGLFLPLRKALSVFTGLLRPIPVMAWVPIVIMWLGIDELSKVVLIAIGTFWTVLVNVMDGIRSTDRKYIEVAQIFEKNKWVLFTKVIFPSALPNLFTGLRIGVDVAWRSVVGAEIVAAAAGMGYMITFAREMGQTDTMLVGIFSIGILGFLIDFILKKLQKNLIKWDQSYGKEIDHE